jgi:hypothetical protein
MKKIQAGIFIALTAALCLTSGAQDKKPYDPQKAFSVEDLKNDLRILWEVLDEGHGGLDRYTPRETLRREFDQAAAGIAAPMNEFDFLVRILPLIGEIKDGHTRAQLSPAAAEFLDDRPVFFPFGLRFLGNQAFLLRNLSEAPSVREGSELLSINGLPIGEIVSELATLIPNDAGILTRKIRQLEFPANFGRLFALRFGRPESFRIRFKPRGDAEMKELEVGGIKGKDVMKILTGRYPDTGRRLPLYELSFRGDVAVLTVRAFANSAEKGSLPFLEFLQASFKTIEEKKAGGLVIDLRENGGGQDDFAKSLFAYVMDRPFLYYKALESRKDHYDLFKYTNVPKADVESLPRQVQKNARGWYDVLAHPNSGIQEPLAPHFAGRVAILIGGLSFSASGETTSLFHYHKKAVFFGEECGAGYYGNTSGFIVMVTLPATGIQVRVPLVLYTMAVDGYPIDKGILPDFPVSPTIDDILAGRDPVMDKAIDWMESGKNPGKDN